MPDGATFTHTSAPAPAREAHWLIKSTEHAAMMRAVRTARADAARVASLGTGGYLNRRSSPIVMWLADQLAAKA